MTKNELLQPELLRECFGTKEWSEKSGICCNCNLKTNCEKFTKHTKNAL